MKKNIVLTGFMACGKSTVGHLLAKKLGRRFIDTDDLIVERQGKSVADIFATEGEAFFRKLEQQTAVELAREEELVIATGGKMLLDPVSAEALGTNSCIFTLVANPEEILRRVLARGIEKRPMLNVENPEEKIRTLLAEREAGYGRFSRITTDGRSVSAVAEEILKKMLEKGRKETGERRREKGKSKRR
ncbi:shikimate kinase [Desulforhopalus vacuolatus]|uniref:shikimate kinase n=1 Tax=Desulforhopalus vacuolatus TaxID=40414 RepID=UPI00196345FD|nr:shikimate kinase [Desulforhopalus vacuolatus]MBM9519380.1 shikimate kinase [Desulforhopalus vacuolatus]